MRHLGDVTKISGADIEPVDVITYGAPCFPKGTLVLTERGYIPIENVSVGLKVLTHRKRWRSVLRTGSTVSDTIILKGRHFGIECTPDHPFYSKEDLNSTPQWTPAKDMMNKFYCVPKFFERLPLPDVPPLKSKKQKRMHEIDGDLMYFAGRWLGDGWVRDGQRSNRPEGQTYGTVILCDSLDKESEIVSIVSKISPRYHVERCRTGVKVKFNNQQFCAWLTSNFGKYAYGKCLPPWVYSLPYELQEKLLLGVIESDGFVSRKNPDGPLPLEWHVTTVSKPLAEGLRILCEQLGYTTSMSMHKVNPIGVIEGREINQRDSYSLSCNQSTNKNIVDEDGHWYPITSIIATEGIKTVYNLEVDEDNSYVAEGFVVHNCQDLSVAGARRGLKSHLMGDEEQTRSGLFFDSIRIVKEMRKKDEENTATGRSNGDGTGWVRPRFTIYENVPGAYSSNQGKDWAAVLEETIRVVEPEAPDIPVPEKGWPECGVVEGDGWSVAWTTHDAQFLGVAQRRKRISLVADYGGLSAGKILSQLHLGAGCGEEVFPQPESLSGYSDESGAEGQGTSGGTERSPFAAE